MLPEPISPPEKKHLQMVQQRVAKGLLGLEVWLGQLHNGLSWPNRLFRESESVRTRTRMLLTNLMGRIDCELVSSAKSCESQDTGTRESTTTFPNQRRECLAVVFWRIWPLRREWNIGESWLSMQRSWRRRLRRQMKLRERLVKACGRCEVKERGWKRPRIWNRGRSRAWVWLIILSALLLISINSMDFANRSDEYSSLHWLAALEQAILWGVISVFLFVAAWRRPRLTIGKEREIPCRFTYCENTARIWESFPRGFSQLCFYARTQPRSEAQKTHQLWPRAWLQQRQMARVERPKRLRILRIKLRNLGGMVTKIRKSLK